MKSDFSSTNSSRIKWLDLLNPSKNDIREIVKKYRFPVSIAEEVLFPTETESLRVYKDRDLVFCILHFPFVIENTKVINVEIDFIVTRDYLITIHYLPVETMMRVEKILEAKKFTKQELIPEAQDDNFYVFLFLLQELYKDVSDQIEALKLDIENLEDKQGHKGSIIKVEEFVDLANVLIKIKGIIENHYEALRSLQNACAHNQRQKAYVEEIFNSYRSLEARILNLLQSVRSIQELNSVKVNLRQSEAVKIANVTAAVVIPITFLLLIFDINISGGLSVTLYAIAFALALTLFIYYMFKKNNLL